MRDISLVALLLIADQIDLNAPYQVAWNYNHSENNVLMYATERGSLATVQLLIKSGHCNLSAKNIWQDTALHLAIRAEANAIAYELITAQEKGSLYKEENIFSLAFYPKNIFIMNLLLNHGVLVKEPVQLLQFLLSFENLADPNLLSCLKGFHQQQNFLRELKTDYFQEKKLDDEAHNCLMHFTNNLSYLYDKWAEKTRSYVDNITKITGLPLSIISGYDAALEGRVTFFKRAELIKSDQPNSRTIALSVDKQKCLLK